MIQYGPGEGKKFFGRRKWRWKRKHAQDLQWIFGVLAILAGLALVGLIQVRANQTLNFNFDFSRLAVILAGLVLFLGATLAVVGLVVFERRRSKIRAAHEIEELLALSPKEFEERIAYLFEKFGFKAKFHRAERPDHGIDVEGANNAMQIVAQAKRYSPHIWVREHEVRDFYGSIAYKNKYAFGYFITTSKFTVPARRWAASVNAAAAANLPRLVLIDGQRLVKLLNP